MDALFSKNKQFKTVTNFADLVNTEFKTTINALCWERNLVGNFKEIVSKLQLKENVTEITIQDLHALSLSNEGKLAREIILNDLKLLANYGALPSLNLIKNYERDHDFNFISTDVYSYHIDRSPIATATFLCTYYGASSDILANNEATKKIEIPEIREHLKRLHNGNASDFEIFLEENYFDLHYQANSNAKPINLGVGNLWKLAVDYPEQKVLPCIHRAPQENNDELRLLLIC